ncbi:hypothetical protein KFE25_012351 [Diacronema lutheri]|uniref:Thioredoxin domain-containing protein n=2 Tax=Diacronema lutheri TaxID=2081491 RepID=A0A8J5XDT6_DIALT|nr:hypothetical protein KFE25_012351 [Diacronema lutheri]
MKHLASKSEFDAFVAEAASKGRTVFVDFTATWCGPCKRIAPVFEALAAEFPHADFVKVDVDENQETAAACGITAMPTIKAYKDGKEAASMRGADEAALREMVVAHSGDKWTAAGSGHALGSADGAAAGAAMSDQQKRLAALERRGL